MLKKSILLICLIIDFSNVFSNSSQAVGLIVDNNQKIVAGGYITTGLDAQGSPTSNFALVRYLTTGVLDFSFNNGGIVNTFINNGAAIINEVLLDNNNKYLVAGGASYFPSNPVLAAVAEANQLDFENVVLARYNQNGSLDTTFGGTGIVQNSIFNVNEQPADAIAYALALDLNNKILVSGFVAPLSNTSLTPLFVLRYNEDGTLDKTFNPTGTIPGQLVTQLTSQLGIEGSININSIGVDSSNRIICTGYFAVTQPFLESISMLTIRLNSDGSFDDTFGNNGVVVTSISGFDIAQGLIIYPDGSILIGGNSSNGFIAVMAMVKYLPNGDLDTSFGNGGLVETNISNNTDRFYAITLDANNNIVAAGFTSLFLAYRTPLLQPSGDNFTIVRYTPDGALDQTFGPTTTTIFTSPIVTVNNNSLVAGPTVYPNTTFSTFGIVQINIENNYPLNSFSPFVPEVYPAAPYSVAIDSAGRILAGGFSSSAVENDMTVMRLLSNGDLDTTFNSPFNTAVPFQPGVVITYLSILLGFTQLSSNSGYVTPYDLSYLLYKQNPRQRTNLNKTSNAKSILAAPILNQAYNNITTNVTNPHISGKAAPGSLVNLFINGTPMLKINTDKQGNWSSILPHLKDGEYSVHAIASDRISSISEPSGNIKFTVQTSTSAKASVDKTKNSATKAVKPVISNTKSVSPIKVVSGEKVITGKGTPDQKISVFVDNVKQAKNAVVTDKSGAWEFKIPKQYLDSKHEHKVAVSVNNTIQNFTI